MIWSTNSISSPSRADAWLARLLGAIALAVAVLLGLVLAFLSKESWPVLRDGGWAHLFRDDGWFPASGRFNLLPMLWATLAASIGALALAIPLGLFSAVFSRFYAPAWLVAPARQAIALLAGIPSVVYGFWGLTVLVPLIALWEPPGASLLAGILILALMVLPTVALTSEAALAAALLMVAGNVVQTPASLFDPVRVLTANIALEMAYATGNHRAGLFAAGLLLMAMVTLLAWLAARGGERDHG